jgi:hypothetical protein
MDLCEVPQTTLSIALLRVLYLAIIMVGYVEPQSPLTIALHKNLYISLL